MSGYHLYPWTPVDGIGAGLSAWCYARRRAPIQVEVRSLFERDARSPLHRVIAGRTGEMLFYGPKRGV